MSLTKKCPGWRGFVDTLPEGEDSEYADAGTLLHNAMERIYGEEHVEPTSGVVGMKFKEHVLTDDLYDFKIVPAIEAVEALFDHYGVTEYETETRVKMSDDAWGTGDLLARGTIQVPGEDEPLNVGLSVDYKFGDGVKVFARENDQNLFYCAAAVMTPETKDLFADIDLFVLAIIQPTIQSSQVCSSWEVDYQRIDDEPEVVRAAIAVAEGDDPPFAAGEHCDSSFCEGRGLCPATSGLAESLKRIDVTNPEVHKNLPTHAQVQLAKSTIKAVEQFIHQQIEVGVPIDGWKIVPKRGTRQYTDEPAVRDIVKRSKKLKRDEAYTSTLKSPAQLEKVCKKKKLDFDALFGEHVKKISSGSTLAADDDKRESVPSMQQLAAQLARK